MNEKEQINIDLIGWSALITPQGKVFGVFPSEQYAKDWLAKTFIADPNADAYFQIETIVKQTK